MIKNLIFVVYLSISDFLLEILKASKKQKLAKNNIHFTIRFCSKNPTHFTNLNPLNIIKYILLEHSQKHVSGWCQKKHLHFIISRRPRTAFSKHMKIKCLYIPPLENICSRDVGSFYLVRS